jgi:hypothetical protein
MELHPCRLDEHMFEHQSVALAISTHAATLSA